MSSFLFSQSATFSVLSVIPYSIGYLLTDFVSAVRFVIMVTILLFVYPRAAINVMEDRRSHISGSESLLDLN